MSRCSCRHRRPVSGPGAMGGSISIEAMLFIPVLLALLSFGSEALQLLRLEQRLHNVAYNVTQIVTQQGTGQNAAAVSQLAFYQRFVQGQLSALQEGQAALTIEQYNSANGELVPLLQGTGCAGQGNWPQLRVGTLMRVTLCYRLGQGEGGMFSRFWAGRTLVTHFIQEIH
ncbi:pilus assembly protein FlpK [Aeromonas salmonicida]|uniref:pilus assembly protein FlpK n=1 Tax=Aeromonas salmonicida TaxID=645 RepID=UPI00259ECE99|nr:pilus assembly protein FlpK [Aeromonas salmonicida]MDM5101017.1 pilus assembly protein FlpK [Aeromonas salmonicida]